MRNKVFNSIEQSDSKLLLSTYDELKVRQKRTELTDRPPEPPEKNFSQKNTLSDRSKMA